MGKQKALGVSFTSENDWILDAVKNSAVTANKTVAEFVRDVLAEYLNTHGPVQQNLPDPTVPSDIVV